MERIVEQSEMPIDAMMRFSRTGALMGGVQLGAASCPPSSRFSTCSAYEGPRDAASISVIIAEQHAKDDLPKMETDVKEWIGTVLEDPLPAGALQPLLKDGIRLCKVLNKLSPGICPEPSTADNPFKQRDNIGAYLAGCKSYGVPAADLFQTVSLFENQYFPGVLQNIFSLSRVAHAKGYEGPALGPRLATETPRHFTERQLAEAAAAPRIFGGVGSHQGMTAELDHARNVYGSMTNAALIGLTTDAKIEALKSKLEAMERRMDKAEDFKEDAGKRLDKLDTWKEMKEKSNCCTVQCVVQ